MDYYKNIDRLGCVNEQPLTARGVQYYTIIDLAEEPVTLDFFKNHARIDFDTDDTLCEVYIKAARQALEKWAQLSFGEKTMGLRALSLPNNYRLMYGRVDEVVDRENFGDILKEGGTNIELTFTTRYWIDDVIRIAICRYAAGLYINRETITETKFSAQTLQDEAKIMLAPYKNITL